VSQVVAVGLIEGCRCMPVRSAILGVVISALVAFSTPLRADSDAIPDFVLKCAGTKWGGPDNTPAGTAVSYLLHVHPSRHEILPDFSRPASRLEVTSITPDMISFHYRSIPEGTEGSGELDRYTGRLDVMGPMLDGLHSVSGIASLYCKLAARLF
jgi:hypothetical protein